MTRTTNRRINRCILAWFDAGPLSRARFSSTRRFRPRRERLTPFSGRGIAGAASATSRDHRRQHYHNHHHHYERTQEPPRDPARETDAGGGAAWAVESHGRSVEGKSPSPRPSPRARGEGGNTPMPSDAPRTLASKPGGDLGSFGGPSSKPGVLQVTPRAPATRPAGLRIRTRTLRSRPRGSCAWARAFRLKPATVRIKPWAPRIELPGVRIKARAFRALTWKASAAHRYGIGSAWVGGCSVSGAAARATGPVSPRPATRSPAPAARPG
jgi:hypothetical protein